MNIIRSKIAFLLALALTCLAAAAHAQAARPYRFDEWSDVAKAAWSGDLSLVKRLIAGGADPEEKPAFGSETALVGAVMGKQKEAVIYLLSLNPREETMGSALPMAVWYGTEEIFRLLVDKANNPNWNILAAYAARDNKTGFLEIVLANAPAEKLAEVRGHALFAAAEKYNIALVKRMLAAGAPLALTYFNDDLTALLAGSPSYVSIGDAKENSRPFAARDEMLSLFLARDIDLNAVDRDGRTALLRFVNPGDVIPVRMLLQKGADPNIAAADGETALTVALRSRYTEIAAMLVNAGANVNARTAMGGAIDVGSTPLIIAAVTGDLDLVKLLVDKGARVEDKDKAGRTALIWARFRKHPEIVAYLLAHGAKDVKNVDRYFPKGGK